MSDLCAGCKLDKDRCKERGYCLIVKTLEYLEVEKQMWKEAENREWVVP